MTTPQQNALAVAFSRIVQRDLKPHLPEIIARNKVGHPGACATHDFCDANELMAEAFKEFTGREPDCADEKDAALWSGAWNAAYAASFEPADLI